MINFFEAYYKIDFIEALRRAGGEGQQLYREPAKGKPVTPPAPVQVLPDQSWQAEAWQEVTKANDRLLGIQEGLDPVIYAMQLAKHNDSVVGREGRKYLASRGIGRAAWVHFNLGYGIVFNRPAIVIPHTDGQIITVVKYRFLDEREPKCKNKDGSKAAHSIFGLQSCVSDNQVLVIVEGELNAVSLWQVFPRDVTVLSCGGNTNGKTELLQAVVRRFSRVIIWMDEEKDAQSMRQYLGRSDARLLKSPVIDGVKYDANQMLQDGLLMDFIGRTLSAECLGVPVNSDIVACMRAKVKA